MLRSMGILIAILAVVIGLGFGVHHWGLNQLGSANVHLLPGFYIMNGLMGAAIGMLIIYLSYTRPDVTGFAFMGGSLLKFAVFFLVFFPDLSEDSDTRKMQFIAFFIPYALSMIVEVWYLIRILNQRS